MPRMGNINYLAAAGKSSSGNYTFLLVIVVLFGLFYFVMIRPQRNRQRQVQQMQQQVMPGQRVRTTAGMYATVIAADDNDVVLEIAPGVQARFLRRAVMDVLPEDDGMDMTGPTMDDEASTPGSAAEDGYSKDTKDLSAGH
jgi:preprotein translocase subunit YajC